MKLGNSLFERLDYYKLTMGQFAFIYYPDVEVEYGLINRTTIVNLLDWIDPEELQWQLDQVSQLRFSEAELAYLAGLKTTDRNVFRPDFLADLRQLRLPQARVIITDNHMDVRVQGRWEDAIYWETIVLSIVNQMYFQALIDAGVIDAETVFWEGRYRLDQKIDKLIAAGIGRKIVEFGTRRALGADWLEFVDDHFNDRAPQIFLGTSNVGQSMAHGYNIIGTYAHETDMILAALANTDEEMLLAHERLLDQWWELYGYGLSIALTDTFGSKYFFESFGEKRARLWKGFRHDSGDPFEFGEKVIAFFQSFGIDPKSKWLVFSDGLDVDVIIALNKRFGDRINLVFGWGTNLTCDIGYPTISLVMKAIFANGRPCVKLSDNLKKAVGSQEDVDHYTQVYGYSNTFEATCVY